MEKKRIVSIIPYKILPAKLGGEKGIALFNEYVGERSELTGIATENNEAHLAANYKLLNILSNSRIRYINPFLYFTVRKIIRQRKASYLLIEHPYYGWLAFLLKRTMNIKWIVHSHNIEYMRSRSIGRWWWKLLRSYERWVYHQTDINFFISDDDRNHAVNELQVSAEKSHAITYGIEQERLPDDLHQSANRLRLMYNIDDDEKILLFNGALYHATNFDSVTVICDHINPELLKRGLKYKIIICGKGLPESFNELKQYREQNIIYAGFVDDISLYFKGADIFLNPILSGGGVKTKAIEALAANCTVISTAIGALGLKQDVCGNKLHICANGDWAAFTELVSSAFDLNEQIPDAFFGYYYWGNIASKVISTLN